VISTGWQVTESFTGQDETGSAGKILLRYFRDPIGSVGVRLQFDHIACQLNEFGNKNQS